MAKASILVVTPYFPPESTGCASRVSDFVERLAAAGARVTVLAPHPTFPPGAFPRTWRPSRKRRAGDVEVVNLWSWQPRRSEPGFASRVAYYLTFPLHAAVRLALTGRKYDAAFVTMPPVFTAFAALVMKRLHRRPTIVDVRDLWIDAAVDLGFVKEGSAAERATRALERRVLESADRVTVVTPRLGARLAARYPTVDRKIVGVPNGVDTRRFVPGERRGRRFVYAGILGPAQDLDTVFAAFAIVARRDADAVMEVAGEGEERPRLEALARDLGLEGRIRFVGILARDAVGPFVASALAALAPIRDRASLDYAVPTKAYEAMACGVPFIGLGRGEIRRLAEASGGGLVPEATPGSVAEAMTALLDDPGVAAAMGKRGRAWVLEHADREVAANRLLKEFRDLVEVTP